MPPASKPAESPPDDRPANNWSSVLGGAAPGEGCRDATLPSGETCDHYLHVEAKGDRGAFVAKFCLSEAHSRTFAVACCVCGGTREEDMLECIRCNRPAHSCCYYQPGSKAEGDSISAGDEWECEDCGGWPQCHHKGVGH